MGVHCSVPWVTESQANVPIQGTMAEALDFEFLEVEEEYARGRFPVAAPVQQPFGIVHGGAYAAMAETLASMATYMAVLDNGEMAMGQSNHTSFLRPVSEGYVNAEARARHRGRTSWVWEVDFTDDEGRLCALTRVTMAVRPAPS
jgi:1,4-dihydroxy-2-naphthoyl-CoA hydrolase